MVITRSSDLHYCNCNLGVVGKHTKLSHITKLIGWARLQPKQRQLIYKNYLESKLTI